MCFQAIGGIEVNMKNYYEILQVNENASPEIIEKAYKVLVKKYHPDLQKDEKIKEATGKRLREINEAYDVLSNTFLKEQYDIELQKEKEEQYKKKYGERNYGTEKTNFYSTPQPKKNMTNEETNKTNTPTIGTFASVVNFVKMLYHDRPKREQYKEATQKDLLAIFLTIIVVIIIAIILWYIPFTNDWIRELIFENPIFKWLGSLLSH